MYFLAVFAAGALVQASVPLLIANAQDLAPHAVSTASGMLMGLTIGVAGLLYIGVGYLQQLLGVVPAMQIVFLLLLPAAFLTTAVLVRYRNVWEQSPDTLLTTEFCLCAMCQCAGCRAPSTARA